MSRRTDQVLKTVLFDLYDTLVYVPETAYRTRTEHFAKLCGVSPSEFSAAWRGVAKQSIVGEFPDTTQRVRAVLRILRIQRQPKLASAIAAMEHDFLRRYATVYDDVLDALEGLRTFRLQLGLVTNASPSVWITLRATGLDAVFNAIVASSEVRVCKPDSGIYTAALNKLDTRPTEAAFVGDGADSELNGAHALGLTTVRLDRNPCGKRYCPSAVDFVIRSLSELPQTLGFVRNVR